MDNPQTITLTPDIIQAQIDILDAQISLTTKQYNFNVLRMQKQKDALLAKLQTQ